MRDSIIDWIRALPFPEPLLVVLVGMTPIFELRGAIPLGREIFGMSPLTAYVWAVIGNMIPVPIILWLFPGFVDWAEDHWPWIHRLMVRLHIRTENRAAKRFERLRDFALITFVAIPLPVTGAWSGSLAAVVFDVPKRRALPLIFSGVLIAGLVVTLFLGALGMAFD